MVISELTAFTLRRGEPAGLTLIELTHGVALEEVKAKTDAESTVPI